MVGTSVMKRVLIGGSGGGAGGGGGGGCSLWRERRARGAAGGRVLSDWRARRKVRAGFQVPCRGQAAATASKIQLAISTVPPVGAALANSPWPANCRKVRSAANSDAAMMKPNAAARP